jgi:dTDP-4-amino-4,6-dideoxygalactose transaminase
MITTSGGGALISEDKAMIDQSRFLATQARDDAPHYEHSHIGYNYRMSNITAGIGRRQLQVLDKHIALRRANNLWYQSIFKAYDFITVFKEPTTDFFSNHWLSCILVNKNSKGITRESLRLAMTEENIECRPLWKPMHQQPIFKHHPAYMNGTSDLLFEKGLCLPSGSNLTAEEYKRIEEALHNALT